MSVHYMTVCEKHQRILSQCRCPGPKTVHFVKCPGGCSLRPKYDGTKHKGVPSNSDTPQ